MLAGVEIIDSANECNGGDDAHHNNGELWPNVVETWNESANGIDGTKQNCNDANPLQCRFPLAAAACRHYESFAGGERPQSLYAGFAEVDKRDHPHGSIPCCDEAHENRHVRNLVAERVEVFAERADFAHGAGKLAVQKIGEHESEHHHEREYLEDNAVVAVVQVVIVEEHPEEKRREHNAAHGELACNRKRLAMRRVAVVPVGVCGGGGGNQQNGNDHHNLLEIFQVQQIDAHRDSNGQVGEFAPAALAGELFAFAEHAQREQRMRNQSCEQYGATDAQKFFGALVLHEVAHENAGHHDELQKTVDSIEPKPVIRFFNFLETELVEVDPAHDERNSDEGTRHCRPSFPNEDDDADKYERSQDAPNARTQTDV